MDRKKNNQWDETDLPRQEDEPPPLLGSWHRLYVAVLLLLAFFIAALYVFTRIFTYEAP